MLIIASKPGQLGNRLFLFANLIGGAIEHGYTLANPSFDEYANYFQLTSRDLFCRYPPRRSLFKGRPAARRLLYLVCYYAARALVRGGVNSRPLQAISLDWDEGLQLADPRFLARLEGRPLLFLQGWGIRDDAALAKHADRVREFFTPLEEFRANVRALIGGARRRGDVLVGVHIRRGDYRTFKGGKYFYALDAYAGLMERAGAIFPGRRVTFLVCSDEDPGGEVFSQFDCVRGTGHFIEDLYALAECDYLMGPPSTYTMWASFYGRVPLYSVLDPGRAPRLEDFAVVSGLGAPDEAAVGHAPPPEREVEGSMR